MGKIVYEYESLNGNTSVLKREIHYDSTWSDRLLVFAAGGLVGAAMGVGAPPETHITWILACGGGAVLVVYTNVPQMTFDLLERAVNAISACVFSLIDLYRDMSAQRAIAIVDDTRVPSIHHYDYLNARAMLKHSLTLLRNGYSNKPWAYNDGSGVKAIIENYFHAKRQWAWQAARDLWIDAGLIKDIDDDHLRVSSYTEGCRLLAIAMQNRNCVLDGTFWYDR